MKHHTHTSLCHPRYIISSEPHFDIRTTFTHHYAIHTTLCKKHHIHIWTSLCHPRHIITIRATLWHLHHIHTPLCHLHHIMLSTPHDAIGITSTPHYAIRTRLLLGLKSRWITNNKCVLTLQASIRTDKQGLLELLKYEKLAWMRMRIESTWSEWAQAVTSLEQKQDMSNRLAQRVIRDLLFLSQKYLSQHEGNSDFEPKLFCQTKWKV